MYFGYEFYLLYFSVCVVYVLPAPRFLFALDPKWASTVPVYDSIIYESKLKQPTTNLKDIELCSRFSPRLHAPFPFYYASKSVSTALFFSVWAYLIYCERGIQWYKESFANKIQLISSFHWNNRIRTQFARFGRKKTAGSAVYFWRAPAHCDKLEFFSQK